MGIKLDDIKELFEFIKINLGEHIGSLSIIELGEEEFKIFNNEKESKVVFEYLKTDPRPYNKNLVKNNVRIGLYAKDFLEKRFSKVLSIDKEGKCPKTLKMNIYDSIKLDQKYDTLINFGHTKDLGILDNNNQNIIYKTFKNIHEMTKKGGLIFNILPSICKKNTVVDGAINYSPEFFDELANLCGYRIFYNNIKLRNSDGKNIIYYVHAHYIKNNNNNFINEDNFMKLMNYIKFTNKMNKDTKKYYENYKIKQ